MDKIIDPAFLNSPWLRDGQHCQHDCEAPLGPRHEQESALSWLGFQEGTATSGLLPHQVLLYPSGCPKCSWGCCTGTIKGPSSWALGWAVEGLSLSILFEEKIGLQDVLFLTFLCLLFSIAVCSERQKRWINCNGFSSLSNTRVVQMQVSECQACFSIIRLHEQQRKETAIKFVSCQEKLSSWRARRLGGEHAGTEGRRW